MTTKRFNTLLIWMVSVPASIWLGAELYRVLLDVSRSRGYAGLIFDGVVQHKMGELLIMFPVLCLLVSMERQTQEKLFWMIGRLKYFIFIGGLLNVLAWFSLRDRAGADSFLRVWCIILFAFAFAAPYLLRLLVEHEKAARSHRA